MHSEILSDCSPTGLAALINQRLTSAAPIATMMYSTCGNGNHIHYSALILYQDYKDVQKETIPQQ